MLQKLKRQKTLLTGLIVLSLVNGLSGEGNFSGMMSPSSKAIGAFENQVFDALDEEREKTLMLYEYRVKDRIQQVIARYKTGLKVDDQRRVTRKIYEESRRFGFDPLFLTAVIVAESSFYNWAKSNRGAMGLMQIRPATAKALASEIESEWKGKPSLYDPLNNISLGAYYLNKLIERFGDLGLALEAYNRGPSMLRRSLNRGNRPHRYSDKVLSLYRKIRTQSV